MTRQGTDQQRMASAFAAAVLARQAVVGVVTYLIVALLAPWSLMLEAGSRLQVWLLCGEAGVLGIILTLLLSLRRVRVAKRVFQALTTDATGMGPSAVDDLAVLPFALTLRFLLVTLTVAALVGFPLFELGALDPNYQLGLALLVATIGSASAIIHYVAVRGAVIRAIELSPIAPITSWLERESLRLAPRQRVTRKILLAVVVPVALVGVGTILVTHAHLQALVVGSRAQIAAELAHAALDPTDATGDSGTDDAIAAAAAHGFLIRQNAEASSPGPPMARGKSSVSQHLPGGQLISHVQLTTGVASIRYSGKLASGVVTGGLLLAALAVFVAALLGGVFGQALAADLVLATRQVASLGAETVLRGKAQLAVPARFAVVADLGRSVEALAERFLIFAAAQQRALDGRAAAQRMKQLLFASVSHDLKSPLNAILGFAELVRQEQLTESQAESLALVSGRGRELLALIETILDAARVEAGQLRLSPRPTPMDQVISAALSKAYDLQGGESSVEISVEVPASSPDLLIDQDHGPRALAVLIAHAMTTAKEVRGRAVRVRVSAAGGPGVTHRLVCLHIEYVAMGDRPSLLDALFQGHLNTSAGRGVVLRLSLARAIIELHGGRVEVGRGPHGAAIVTCWLPTNSPLVSQELDGPTQARPPKLLQSGEIGDEDTTVLLHRDDD